MNTRTFWAPRFERIPEEKRQRILDCAVTEFAEKGLAAANTSQIARAACISVGSLFQYFPTKERLYLAVVDHGLGTLEASLRPVMDSSEPLVAKISAVLDAIFASRGVYDDLNRLYNRFTTEADAEWAARLSSRFESITANLYSRLIRDAQADGSAEGSLNPRVAAFCLDNIFLMLQFSMSNEYYRDRMDLYLDGRPDDAELKSQILAFIKAALGIRGAS